VVGVTMIRATGGPAVDPDVPGDGRSVRGAAHRLLTAGQVMNRRPPVADQDTSLWGAWELLRGPDNRHLVVVDRQVRPVGVLEERDLAVRWPPGPRDAHLVPLRRLLGGAVDPGVSAGEDLAVVARAMLTARTDAVPVVDDDGRLIGLVTARHCVDLVACRLVH
jgi:CBS domain-containing protein